MNKKLIVVAGYLASGKSTFVRRLSNEIGVPYLIKDTLKIALCESIPVTNREDGSRFSAVTFDAMMYVTERLIETGYPIIIEGNFVPAGMKKVDEASVIKALSEKYDCPRLTYKFIGDTRILHERYIEREKSLERGDANRDFEEIPHDRFDRYCHNLDAFDVGGEVIQVDTTDFEKVNFGNFIEIARSFINNQ